MKIKKILLVMQHVGLAVTLTAIGAGLPIVAFWPASVTAQQGNDWQGSARWVVMTDRVNPYIVDFSTANGVFASTIAGVRPSPASLPMTVRNSNGDSLRINYVSETGKIYLDGSFTVRTTPPLPSCNNNQCKSAIDTAYCEQTPLSVSCLPDATGIHGCLPVPCTGGTVTPCPDNEQELCAIVNAGKGDY